MITTAIPFANLSVKLIMPYTNAPLSVLSPIRSAVIPRLVTRIMEPQAPENCVFIDFYLLIGKLPIKTAIMWISNDLNWSPEPNLIQRQADTPNKTPKTYDSFNDSEISFSEAIFF
jgi:hypothetical protein